MRLANAPAAGALAPDRPMPPVARALFGVLVLLLAAYVIEQAVPLHLPAAPAELFEKCISNTLFLGAALMCGWRAIAFAHERTAWMLLALGLLAWGLGDLYYTFALWGLERVPVPSLADAGYLALYPLAVAGLVSLFRSRVSRQGRLLWVDGLIGALAVAAIAATVLFGAILDGVGGSPASVATNISYPLADLLLAAFVAGVLGMSGWQLNSTWARLGAGLVIFMVTDALYLYMSAAGTYGDGNIIDVGWPLAALVIARAAWASAPVARPAATEQWRAITFPLAFGLSSLALLIYDHHARVNALALWLAATAMLAVLLRLALTFADNLRMLAASQSDAHTDALTGLGNRRALMGDLAHAVGDASAGGHPRVLAMFDLDGFKHYNDSFGHPAGDALLTRLGNQLRRGLETGWTAYRVGGDEFCILCECDSDDEAAIARGGALALTESGEGFAIGCSYGSVVLPRDANTAEAALCTVDERMYQRKQNGRSSAGRQSGSVLHQALTERDPELGVHGWEVAELAASVASQLGLSDADVQTVRLAAELHDIGKVAIPDAILDKPGALNRAETEFVRRHTIIGERIIGAAPALSSVARVVRSSHERLDGGGYPDGLSGEEIPLASRIVFACDAFHAMISDRPYSAGLSENAALAELRRCALTQFDPVVVEAFCAVRQPAAPAPAMAGIAS